MGRRLALSALRPAKVTRHEGPDGKAVGALSNETGKSHPTRMKTTEIVQELCEWQTFENV
jgi:hypothetical protein